MKHHLKPQVVKLLKFTRQKTLFLLTITFILTFFCCKSQKDGEESEPLNPKFQSLDSLNFLGKWKEINKILDTIKPTLKKGDIRNLTYYYYYRGLTIDDDRGRNLYADSALNFFKHIETQKKYPNAYIKILLIKGYVFKNIKRYDEALDYYLKIKSIVEAIDHKNEIRSKAEYGEYIQNIANIYFYQRHYNEAARYYKMAFEIYSAVKDYKVLNIFYLKQGSLNNVGYAYEKVNRLDDAEAIYRKGLALLEEEKKLGLAKISQISQSQIMYLDNLGGILTKKGQLTTARKLLENALQINAYKHERSKVTVHEKLAIVYTKLKLYDKAAKALKNTEKLIIEYPVNNYFVKPRLEMAKSNFFLAKKDYLNSNKHLNRYVKLIDSINNEEDEMARIDLDSKYQIIQVKQDMEFLEQSNEHKSMYLIFASIFIVMLIPIILLAQKSAKQAKKAKLEADKHSKELEKVIAKLEDKNKDYAKMMKVMAHDLKNPLSGMVVIAHLLLTEDHFNDEEREMLELIVTSGENMVEMIDQLLKSGLAIENEVITKEKIDIRQLLRQCTELLHYKANDKDQRLSFVSHGNAEIMASREKIWRVFNNLIVNSIKFSPEGTQIKVVLEKLGSAIRVSVADQGIGVDEKDREKIFEMFTEAKRPGTAGEQPFGIGLSISKQIIESHNGKIWLKDNPGGGTIFYVELPI